MHFATPRFSGCQQSYIKHETSARTDWQHPVTYKARLVRHYQLLEEDKEQQKTHLGIFEAPLHVVSKLLHVVYGQQRIIKQFFPQLFLRLKGHQSNSRTS